MHHSIYRRLPRPLFARFCTGLGFWLLASMTSGALADGAFTKAMASANKRQLTEWGRRFQHGEGVGRDLDKAIRLYCKAAKKGDVDAQYYLGYMYANGTGVRRDEELAAAWLHLAAAQKDPQSQRILKHLGFSKKPKRAPSCALSDGSDAIRPPAQGRYTRLARGPLGPSRTHLAKGPIADLARNLAEDYKLDPNLVLAVIETESNFDPNARSPKNAQGLMQLIPATAQRFGVQDPWDPEQNLRGGMSYLRWLLRYFDGDLRLTLAAYNAGEGAVVRHGGVPPFPETQHYVSQIMGKLGH